MILKLNCSRPTTLMQKFKKIVFLYLPPILWSGFIFYLSAQPDLKVSEGIWDLILRKIGHILEYFILVILASRAAAGSILKIDKKSIILGILFSFLFAISDEYHQTFIHGRQGAPGDVGIDGLGMIFAAFYLLHLKNK